MKTFCLSVLMASASILSALGADVSEAEAEEAVRGWLALREALGGVVDAQPESVVRHSGKDGKGAYYVVSFEGGGFAVASGDTAMEPILAYSAEGEWVDDETKNPLMAMLGLDVAASSGNGESSFAKATEDEYANVEVCKYANMQTTNEVGNFIFLVSPLQFYTLHFTFSPPSSSQCNTRCVAQC